MLSYLARVAVVALAYFVTAKLGLELSYAHGSVTAVWPPTGIALAAVLIWGPRLWLGVALGAFLANSWTGVSLGTVLGITTGNTLEALVGAYLLRRVRFRPSLDRVRDVIALAALAAGLSTTVSATVGVTSLLLSGSVSAGDYGSTWRVWWLGDMGGDLLVAPLLLVAATSMRSSWRPARVGEAGALLVVLLAACALALSRDEPLAYLVFPALIWAALRFRQPGAAAASVVVAAIAVWLTERGVGPFVRGSPDESLLLSQTFMGVAAATALLLAAATTERMRAEQERARLLSKARFLAESSKILAASLDYEETLKRVARLAATDIADWCVVDIRMNRAIKRVATAHVDPSKVELVELLRRRYPLDPEAAWGAAEVVRTGRSELYADVPDSLLVDTARDPEHLELLRSLGMSSAMVVPMLARGRPFGAITMVSAQGGRRFDRQDLGFAEELAHRAATAIDNARLYLDRSRVAKTLQESLLPPELPHLPGLELAVRFRPAGAGTELGGDFYDVFETAGSGWAIVMGDVCGKGAEAARLTGLARDTLRAAGLQGLKPSQGLMLLNETMLRQSDDFCTVLYGRLERDRSGTRLQLTSAGHPLPQLLHADGRLEEVGRYGTMLGVVPEPDLTEQTVELSPGDALVLYTDGVSEARTPAGTFGSARLSALIQGSAEQDATGIAERIESVVLDAQGGDPRDDIAILVLSVPAPHELSMELAAGPEAAHRARAALAGLESHMRPDELSDLRLLATELVTNSVKHMGGIPGQAVGLTVSVSPERVRLEVADRGPGFDSWRPPSDPERTSGWGLFLVDRLTDRWGVRRQEGTCVWLEVDRRP
jgi:serine phosphatase RsbU (regulator of sigma subunit)/integral membrane sensor domain MASE1/anti-sigma regulatory factor (Ser/Thr protein kinase)